jgi:hypothetical protein
MTAGVTQSEMLKEINELLKLINDLICSAMKRSYLASEDEINS